MELMLPVQIIGLALAGRALLEKYAGAPSKDVRTPIDFLATNFANNINGLRKRLSAVNPLNPLFRALEPSMLQFKRLVFGDGQERDDYEEIIEKFMPDKGELLLPERPSYTRELHLTDLDGDTKRELIASFRLKDEIRTIILKKGKDGWYKASEISNPGYHVLNYRNVVDISGTSKRHLVLGLSARGKPSVLCGYTFENDEVHEVFSYECNKFDVLRKSTYRKVPLPTSADMSADVERSAPLPADIVLWNKLDDGTYDISILRWNGIEFKPAVGDYTNYYRKKAVPYLAIKAKYDPYSVTNWYNLAEALVKAGAYSDALTAIKVGIDMDKEGIFKDRFQALKNECLFG